MIVSGFLDHRDADAIHSPALAVVSSDPCELDHPIFNCATGLINKIGLETAAPSDAFSAVLHCFSRTRYRFRPKTWTHEAIRSCISWAKLLVLVL
jgi:hypothetical protein